MQLLEVESVRAGYGEFEALHDVSLAVAEGETVAVVGANGAGKSTLLKVIAGIVRPSAGSTRFAEAPLGRKAPHTRVRAGISLVPEGRRIFRSLSVRENLMIGAYGARTGAWTVGRVAELFPMLERHLDRSAANLSGGEQQAVAIGRALMSNPRLLLLDEVSLGLAPIVVKQLYGELPKIQAAGTTTLIVEQDVGQALEAADRVVCMLRGKVSLEAPAVGLGLDQIRDAYFGT